MRDGSRTTKPSRVTSTDGVSLAVHESGNLEAPALIAIHGYPDNHAVWDGAAGLLAERFHVVTYDVRGCGASDRPGVRSAYRLDQLVADFAAVADAVSPGEAVHVLAHDWGSIQGWAIVTDERLTGRIASFTSISGPSLDYSAAWLRQVHRHPAAVLKQLAHSYYIALFQLPGLPEFAVRRGVLAALVARSDRRSRSAGAVPVEAVRSESDQINGLWLYRANMVGMLGRPRPVPTRVPIQLIVPTKDAFVTADLAVEAARPWVENLTTRVVSGGHWVVSERPDVIARMTAEFIDSLELHNE